jgi:hypothetical protein
MTDKQIKKPSLNQRGEDLAFMLVTHFEEVYYSKSIPDLSETDLSNLLAALKATLRTLAEAQVRLGRKHKDAGVALRKARQQRVAADPTSRKVVISAEEFEAYKSYKDSLVSNEGSKE